MKTIPAIPLLIMCGVQFVIDVILIANGINIPAATYIFGTAGAVIFAMNNKEWNRGR